MTTAEEQLRAAAGLCGSCLHALVRPTRRATMYLRCGLSAEDARFPRYPRLPVVQCGGYRPAPPGAPTGSGQA